ncbi:MAG: bifunctional glutamate N-acetyltransferase/amino-acid acetyltransferase ArgJ [Spirochaetaceae bacterium]|jgi:glutamate N-acetyltransferase/amino-acid N-acetyltransferase|nr:bifunctional glutamate N-acetyltransferase/amino-acid acetyltransferase ArgJ [Spirochaetaceae bacterium]
MEHIEGGVTAAKGFTANGVCAGIKPGRTKPDLALIYSETSCAVAGVYTQNLVKAEPVKLTRLRTEKGSAQAVIANSGNANACTGEQGMENALRMTRCAAVELGAVTELSLPETAVLVCSTGVIGQQLPIEVIEGAVPSLVQGLSTDGHKAAREAIMTTDTYWKEDAVRFEIGGKTVTIGTMAKGSGMIHINMGTMLGFITTDCAISAEMLDAALRESAESTYNCVSVDGDTSTNDTLLILANGLAGNPPITARGRDFDIFLEALNEINTAMARKLAADGEGAEHLIECRVAGARTTETARALAKSVISSSLVKAAFFGKDANWGRILCAMGYSGELFTPETTSVSFSNSKGTVKVFDRGVPLNFDEEKAKIILTEKEVGILIEMEEGNSHGTAWGCDLTYKYVEINGDYRT